ncbi:MAG: hypothetical protein IJE44_00490 [Clostridia bacterium]|nr:hypothetical protein [Clostridia bacterium]
MKKIVALLIAVMMLSTVALAADIDSAAVNYKTITVSYEGYAAEEQATIMVYQVGNDSTAPAFSEAAGHVVVGIDQDEATGEFEIRLDDPNYTGYLVAAVATESSAVDRYSIEVVGGVPQSITTVVDCENGEITVPNGKTLDIGYLKLVQANVNIADGGTVTYENEAGADLDLAGSILFDANGNINSAVKKSPVTLTLATGATKAVGFIWNDTLNGTGGTYGYSVTDGSKTVPGEGFAIGAGLTGNVRFAVGVTGVPVSSNLSISINGIQ